MSRRIIATLRVLAIIPIATFCLTGHAGLVVHGPAVLIPTFQDTPNAHDTINYISADGKTMVVTVLRLPWPNISYMATRTWDDSQGSWGASVALGLPHGDGDFGACLSPDGNTLYYGFGGPYQSRLLPEGGWSAGEPVPGYDSLRGCHYFSFNGWELHYTYYTSSAAYDLGVADYDSDIGGFVNPRSVTSVNSVYNDGGSWISSDGQVLVFNSDRPGGYGGQDLYSATWNKDTQDWNEPVNLGPYVNTSHNEGFGRFAEDANLLFFFRAPGGDPATYENFQAPAAIVPEEVPNQNPVADAGPPQTVTAQGPFTQVTLDGSNSFDPDGDPLTYEWSIPGTQPSPVGSTVAAMLPVGPTLVTLVVTDGRGGVATADVLITVSDTTPPVVVCTTNKSVLWPPNHHVEQVTVGVQASDVVTDPNRLQVTAIVSSNEPDDALGDGQATGDVDGQDGYTQPVPVSLTFDADLGWYVGTVSLRAERDGTQESRVYSIVCSVVDAAGNQSTASCVVVVPHDRRKK